MSSKKSVFLSTRTVEWIESTTKKDSHDQGPKWSEALNATVDQFRFLLKSELPDLTMDEWTVILNVYTGCYFPAHSVPARIASDMMDNVGAVDLAELSPDYAEMVKKIHALTQIQQLAILYFVQIFWSSDWKGDWEEIVTTIKSRF
jgi:hypothetical protein